MSTDFLITFGSWEGRFLLGLEQSLADFEVGSVLSFYYSEYDERTAANRKKGRSICNERGISLDMRSLSIETPVENWRSVINGVQEFARKGKVGGAIIDISTMPREIIWYICWVLGKRKVSAQYVYYSPESYGEGWLSRDPRAPRLVYKLAGVAKPERRTALLVTAGFDPDRARRLVNWFEPDRLFFGLQVESKFRRNSKEMLAIGDALNRDYECTVFELDAFGDDRGESSVSDALSGVIDTHNVVLASLGPKLTAISLFNIHRRMECSALVYAPANQFSENYSSGIGNRYTGQMKWD